MSDHVKNLRSTAAYKWFGNRHIKAFYNSVVTPTLRIGAQVLMQVLFYYYSTSTSNIQYKLKERDLRSMTNTHTHSS